MAVRKTGTRARRWLRRGAWIAGTLLVTWFAVEGGEYGTRALLTQHARHAQLTADAVQLRHEIDSLQKELNAVQHDNATIERIAREQYGMVRGNKELLFWTDGGRSHGDSSVTRNDTSAARR